MDIGNSFIKQHDKYNSNFVLSFENTECLRGIAILLVIIQHISGGFGTNLLTPCGGTGVAIFLFISGFGLNESYKINGLKGFWIKKILRVFLPYFILEFIFFVIYTIDIKSFLLDISGINTSYWYVGFILKWYVIYYFSIKFMPKYSSLILLFFGIIMIFMLPGIQAEQSFSFLCGVIASNNIQILKKKSLKTIFQIAIISLLIGCIFLYLKQMPLIRKFDGSYLFNIVQCFIKLPFAFFFIFIFPVISILRRNRVLFFSGMISYELYLIHMELLKYSNNSILNILVLLLISYLVSYIFHRINIVNAKIFTSLINL